LAERGKLISTARKLQHYVAQDLPAELAAFVTKGAKTIGFKAFFHTFCSASTTDLRGRMTPVCAHFVGGCCRNVVCRNVVLLSPDQIDLDERVQARLASMEIIFANLKAAQIDIDDETFLARIFELRAGILKVRGSLKQLKSVISDHFSGKMIIAVAAIDMYDDIEDLCESLQGLVDLRLINFIPDESFVFGLLTALAQIAARQHVAWHELDLCAMARHLA
jgi:hypothetical protein